MYKFYKYVYWSGMMEADGDHGEALSFPFDSTTNGEALSFDSTTSDS